MTIGINDDEAVEQFLEVCNSKELDTESEHYAGDRFIVELLRSHGYPKLAAAFYEKQNHWWYA